MIILQHQKDYPNELWQTAKKNVEAGDYVIITFGHNDEKNGGMDGVALYQYYKSIGDEAKAVAVDLLFNSNNYCYFWIKF